MSRKRNEIELRDYLNDILEMISASKEFTRNLTQAEFKKDKKTVRKYYPKNPEGYKKKHVVWNSDTAGVAELVDARDLKSKSGLRTFPGKIHKLIIIQ